MVGVLHAIADGALVSTLSRIYLSYRPGIAIRLLLRF